MQCRQSLTNKLSTLGPEGLWRPCAQYRARVVDLGAKAESKGGLRRGRTRLKEEVGPEVGTGSRD